MRIGTGSPQPRRRRDRFRIQSADWVSPSKRLQKLPDIGFLIKDRIVSLGNLPKNATVSGVVTATLNAVGAYREIIEEWPGEAALQKDANGAAVSLDVKITRHLHKQLSLWRKKDKQIKYWRKTLTMV